VFLCAPLFQIRPFVAATSSRPLHVMHVFATSGTVPYLTWFAQRAAREGDVRFTFLVMYHERPGMMDEMPALGFDCRWIRYDPKKRKRGLLKALPWLWWNMMRYRPDVVHGHLFDDTLPAMIAAWAARIRSRLYTRQDSGYHWNYAPTWVFLDRLVARFAHKAVACSGDVRAHMTEKEGIAPEKVAMVHHGIPPDRYTRQDAATMARLRARFGLDGKGPVFGTLARFIEWKGYVHIVDAAALIVRRYPLARFLFCGTGPQEPEIRQRVNDRGLQDHIIFTGWVDRDDVPSLFGIMDGYLHAADHEPFGFVYAEAMMAGIPVVSTPTGAALDAIEDGVSGILVNERSGPGLAEGVYRLMAGDRTGMGLRGKEAALRLFTLDTMYDGYMRLYRGEKSTGG
jgi:glycosyltransferase involved in cell wall biosynthesis